MTLLERVKHDVMFDYYRDGALWYKCADGFVFPVPVSDTDTAIFKNTDKGIYFMRWIRKWEKELENDKKD